MKKSLIGLILIVLLVLPAVGLGQLPTDLWRTTSQGPQQVPRNLEILKVFERIVDWMFTILLIVAAMYIVMAAFSFITAQGDVEKVAKARQWVLMALVGVAVAFMARGLVFLIQQIICGGGPTSTC